MTIGVLRLDDIERIVREEVSAQGAHVHEFLRDADRLYARTINAPVGEVAHEDCVQAGVAVRVISHEVSVRPYIFRQVCINGAISATSEEAEEFDLRVLGPVAEQETKLRETIAACGHARVLPREVERFRSFRDQAVDRGMMMVTMMQTHLANASHSELLDILAQFDKEEANAWGVMNAVTAVARRTRDAKRKWQLEEIGALIPAIAADPFRHRLNAQEWSDLDCLAEERELVLA